MILDYVFTILFSGLGTPDRKDYWHKPRFAGTAEEAWKLFLLAVGRVGEWVGGWAGGGISN
jgi:hypothetical protein